jgi:exosome complex component RRP4
MSTELLKKERELVLPGDEIVKSMDLLPGRNCFREGDSIFAKRLGIVSVSGRVISVISLNSAYMPKQGDMVIGEIEDIQPTGWVVNINSAYDAYMPLKGVREFIDTTRSDLSSYYAVGDIIYSKISEVSQGSVRVSMQDPRSRKLRGGRIAKINPAKVPRLIGKQGSMIMMIKNKTNCRISVGQNGFVWIEGEKASDVVKLIKIIEEQSASEGLTDKIADMLGVKPEEKLAASQMQSQEHREDFDYYEEN